MRSQAAGLRRSHGTGHAGSWRTSSGPALGLPIPTGRTSDTRCKLPVGTVPLMRTIPCRRHVGAQIRGHPGSQAERFAQRRVWVDGLADDGWIAAHFPPSRSRRSGCRLQARSIARIAVCGNRNMIQSASRGVNARRRHPDGGQERIGAAGIPAAPHTLHQRPTAARSLVHQRYRCPGRRRSR